MWVVLTRRKGSDILEMVRGCETQQQSEEKADELRSQEPWDHFETAEVDE
jgi:hypothetical protein